MTPTLTALPWMMGALVSFTLMAISGRELSAELNTFQILAYRSAAAIGYAAAHTTTRFLTQHDPVLAILFYMSAIQLPLGMVPALYGWVWPSTMMWGWVVIVGVSGLSAHYALARALKLADASVVVPIDFMRLPLVSVVGYLVYGEIIDVWVGVGAVIICLGIFINLRDAARLTE